MNYLALLSACAPMHQVFSMSTIFLTGFKKNGLSS